MPPKKIRPVDEAYRAWSEAPSPEAEQRFFEQLKYDAGAISRTVLGEVSEDLSHDIATAAFLKVGQFRGASQFSTWFYRLARNRCMDVLRARQRTKERVDDETSIELEEFAGTTADPDARLLFQSILEWLTDEERELLLGKLHNEDEAALAELLNTPRENVKRRWFRLKEKLRELLDG